LGDNIYQRKNLSVIWEMLKRNRGAGGIEGEDLETFEAEPEANPERLDQELKDGIYAPRAMTPKPSCGWSPGAVTRRS
jgi:hypothetical protein